MLRALLFVLIATLCATSAAAPDEPDQKSEKSSRKSRRGDTKAEATKPEPPPPPPRTPGPNDAKAVAALEKIVAGPDSAARKLAIEELTELAPTAIEAIGEWLVRPHTSTVEDRRAVLAAINAAVPDKSGKFAPPPRQTGKERKADDEVDWLPNLLELDPAMVGVGETIADDAAIRALSATKAMRATEPIFEAAFNEGTMIYRDECGRYLRKLEPYSIPYLTKQSAKRDNRKRYATYQLERLDRQEPGKAFGAAAGDEVLTIAIIETFSTTKIREAVYAMWGKVNDDRPRVREAARKAWMDYITGPPPPSAPMKKLQLPGGKLTKKEKPLWLTYRELADNELRQAANELLLEDYPIEDPMSLDDVERPKNVVKIDLVEVTNRLFDYYDGERAKQDGAAWATAKAKADGGDLAAAAGLLDRLLAQNPARGEREGMAGVYFAYGKQLADKEQWADAAAAYSKAHGLDPKGAKATEALAAHHYMLGKSLQVAGKDGGPDFRRAVALKPDYEAAEDAAESSSGGGTRPVWMLYAAIVAGGMAALLFAVAMVRRRRV